DPAAVWPRATPGRNWVVLEVAVRRRMVVQTESLRIPNRHDTGSTSPRSVGEVALIWDTISHYSPVLIAPLAINFIFDRQRVGSRRCGPPTAGNRHADTNEPPPRPVDGHLLFLNHPPPLACFRDWLGGPRLWCVLKR